MNKIHGNSTHNVWAASQRLIKGQPFDGYMRDLYIAALGRRGLTEKDLQAMGALGDIVCHTTRLSVVAELVWNGLLMAGYKGDIDNFYSILKDHGHRFDQAIRALHKELELAARDNGIIDYEAILEAEDEDKDD